MKERPFPPHDSAPLLWPETSTQHRLAARRLRWLAAWTGSAALALSLAGCPQPGDLENVDGYCKPGASIVDANGKVTGCSDSATSAGSGGGGATPSCDSACISALFSRTCVACHSATTPMGGLDLESAGVTARLTDQPAKHQDVQGCPSGDKLVDHATPGASWLLKKVAKEQGACGTPMPVPGGGSAEDIACVTAYVNCIGGTP